MGFFKSLGNAIFGVTLDELEFRIIDQKLESLDVKIVQARGLIPVRYSDNIKAVCSIADRTEHKNSSEELNFKDGNTLPVLCSYESYSSPSGVFNFEQDIGFINDNNGWTDWVQLLVIPLQLLIPANRGERKFEVVVFLNGREDTTHYASLLNPTNSNQLRFNYFHASRGFNDINKEVNETNDLTVKIAVAIAMSEGTLDDKEGNTIKNWIINTIEIYNEKTKQELKEKFNKSFKESYKQAKDGKLNLGKNIRRFEEIADENAKYKCLDLCYAVMAADGVAAPEELEMIEQISSSLKLNTEELSKIRDSNLAQLNTKKMDSDNLEVLLNIDTKQSKSEIKKHLNKEFQKWNSRINTITNEMEKKKAQEMIDLISTARKKYK